VGETEKQTEVQNGRSRDESSNREIEYSKTLINRVERERGVEKMRKTDRQEWYRVKWDNSRRKTNLDGEIDWEKEKWIEKERGIKRKRQWEREREGGEKVREKVNGTIIEEETIWMEREKEG
jgi:hypothetical protein